MRVLHLVGQQEDNGGILSVIRGIQGATASHGIRHTVWVREGYVEKRGPSLEYRQTKHLISDSPGHLRLFLGALAARAELKKLCASEKFDLIHAHSRGGFLLALQNAVLPGSRNSLFTNHAYARRTRLYRFASARPRFHTVLLTPNMARHYGMEGGRQRVRIIPACCSDEFFSLPTRPDSASLRRPVQLVGVGNIVRWKAWDLVPKALSELNSEERSGLRFDHWGPVPADEDSPRFEKELHELCRRQGLESVVTWNGPTTRVPEVLASSSWFVIPSTDEPCSVALMEALAAGIPVLATRSGGNVDLIRDGRTGLLFEPGNERDLAAKLRMILRGEVRLEPSEKLRESVRDKSATVVGAAYARLYAELAGKGLS